MIRTDSGPIPGRSRAAPAGAPLARYPDGMLADRLDLTQPLIWTVPDLLSADECLAIVARMDAAGTAPAPITTAAGFVHRPDIRNNTRVIFDDLDLAAALYPRLAPHVPARMKGMHACGLNERFRCYRYEPGQRFAPHYDGCFARTPRERSWLTFMVYLNDGFTGGETDFPLHRQKIVPRRGTALLFQHALLHEGCTVTAGVKYALRSDIMYQADPADDPADFS